MMKLSRKFCLTALIMLSGSFLFAQEGSITILTFGGYTFEDKLDFYKGYGKVGDGFQWGVGLEIGLGPYNAVEFNYQQLPTTGYLVEYLGGFEESGDVNFNYYLVGGTRYLPINDMLSGFFSMDAGLAVISPQSSSEFSNTTKFAWGLRTGLRLLPAERVSLRIHAQLLSPVQAAGGSFYFGTGGPGAGVSTYSTIYQFNLGGSINLRIK
ncbi:MAG: hypothetical protein P8X57_11280 [Cyclobacteriaceae bacterium]